MIKILIVEYTSIFDAKITVYPESLKFKKDEVCKND